MKLISWNVNGLRACIQKGFLEQFNRLNADFFCLQETKLQPDQLVLELPGYEQYWCYAEKKGYSGTAIFTKHTPRAVTYGIGVPELDTEGRVITLEYDEFYLVTCYTPNAQRGLARLEHRMKWDEAFRGYLSALDEKKPVILCGDMNVAHQEIDLKNPKSNRGNAGFSDEERGSFTKTLELGFTDTFRHLNPDATGIYSWWSYMYHARENNAGWRIDYFLVSDRVKDAVYKAPIYMDIMGSDHCPVGLEIDLLCNGSIWSPTSTGEARDITPVKEKKLSPAAKAAVTTALLCVLLIGGFFAVKHFLPGNPQLPDHETTAPSEPVVLGNLFTVTVPDTPMRYLKYLPTYSSSLDWYHPCFTNGDEYYYLGDFANADSNVIASGSANFWLIVTLTEDGRKTCKDGVPPQVSLNDKLQGRTEFTYYIVEYNTELNQNSEDGWIIFGRIHHDVPIEISLGTETKTCTVSPLPGSMLIDQATIFPYNDSPTPVIIADSLLSSSFTQHGLSFGEDIFILHQLWNGIDTLLDTEANFWFRVSLTAEGMSSYKEDIFPMVTHFFAPGYYGGDDVRIKVQSYSTLYHEDHIAGWIISGYAPSEVLLQISLGDQAATIQAGPAPAYDIHDIVTIYNYKRAPAKFWMDSKTDSSLIGLDFAGDIYFLGRLWENSDTIPAKNENFWIRVELTEQGRALYSEDLFPDVRHLEAHGDDGSGFAMQMQCYYEPDEPGQVAGWIITGSVDYDSALYISLGTNITSIPIPYNEILYGVDPAAA